MTWTVGEPDNCCIRKQRGCLLATVEGMTQSEDRQDRNSGMLWSESTGLESQDQLTQLSVVPLRLLPIKKLTMVSILRTLEGIKRGDRNSGSL